MSPSPGERISILIVDDHAVVRQGVRAFLETQPDFTVLADVGSGQEAVRLAVELVPDVTLMDLVMPGMDGVETTRRLKQVSPRTQVIVLTSYHQDEHIFPAIRAGALSYLLKDVDSQELAGAVRKAARGEAVLHPRVAARVVQELHGATRSGTNAFTELSERELEVLRLIALGHTNAEIAEQLYLSVRTVETHRAHIQQKLRRSSRSELVRYAFERGLVSV
jgi:two-component system, NarL family, response regulator LiaR